MPAHRFFLEDTLHHATAALRGDELHHLQHVMRAKPGDAIELVNGKGVLALARVKTINNSEAVLEIEKKIETPPSSHQIILAQAFLRPALLDWVIEKGTELGATEFWLFPGEQSEKKEITPHQMQRLHQLTIGGLKQCGRLHLPNLVIKPSLLAWEKPAGTLLFGSLSSDAKSLEDRYPSPVMMVIGPEKGFTEKEQSFLETKLQATPVTLNLNTLRAETAALCALSLLSWSLSKA